MSDLRQLWRSSLLFRRIVTASGFALAAVLVSVGSHIQRAGSLPDPELNKKAVAQVGDEQMLLERPRIGEGELVLSYTGTGWETADLWLENATLDARSQRLFGAPATAGRISYTSTGAAGVDDSNKACHTTIEIRRAKDSAPLEVLKLYQSDSMAGAQRFRQVVLDAGKTNMEILAHTDPPEGAARDLPGCGKLLTVGSNAPVDMPPLPVTVTVEGGKIDLHFHPTAKADIWTGEDKTFEAVSLGGGSARASGLQIVAATTTKKPPLEVRAEGSSDGITFSGLRLGAKELSLDVGRVGEKAYARENGTPIYTYDLLAAVQKNQVVSMACATFLLPLVVVWVKKNCFPGMKE